MPCNYQQKGFTMNIEELRQELATLERQHQRWGGPDTNLARMVELRTLIRDAETAAYEATMQGVRETAAQNIQASFQAMQAKRVEAERAAQAQAYDEMKAQAEATFVANGGTKGEFLLEWPSIHIEMLRQRTIAAMNMGAGSVVDKFIAARNKENA
jgi:hypothetical protein